jgi:hypothetical protein
MKTSVVFPTVLFVLFCLGVKAQEGAPRSACKQEKAVTKECMTILWSSGDPDVFHNCILPYSTYSCQNECWKEVTLIMWGPSVGLLSENINLQVDLGELISKGLKVKACEIAAQRYHVKNQLERIGVEVKSVNDEVTRGLKGQVAHLITL